MRAAREAPGRTPGNPRRLSVFLPFAKGARPGESQANRSMKILFSANPAEVKSVRKQLFEAGIPCRVRNNKVANGLFGIPAYPELWIKNEGDIITALKMLGPRRLKQMTVIVPSA